MIFILRNRWVEASPLINHAGERYTGGRARIGVGLGVNRVGIGLLMWQQVMVR
jgi:hypothetical protein